MQSYVEMTKGTFVAAFLIVYTNNKTTLAETEVTQSKEHVS